MLGTTASRIAIAATSALAASAVLALPARADIPMGPRETFFPQVLGTRGQNQIELACAGPRAFGRPLAGQSVVVQSSPTGSPASGLTGNFGTQIQVDVSYTRAAVTTVTPIATLTSYGVKAAIPTSIPLPCSGTGVVSFTPAPDPDGSGRPADLAVSFPTMGF